MGTFYHLSCSNCSEFDKTVSLGIGMMYQINQADYRLFSCKKCGDLFERNINKKYNRCPKCKIKAIEIKVIDNEDDDTFPCLETTVKCLYCKTGDIVLSFAGIWD
jgi:DNA-directed RNA polymerase subunit RPC12/RpoP